MNGVSVIICCYNAAARINKTLEHLQKQIVTDEISWEVIVVDNASTDNTSSIGQIKWNEHPVTELKVVAESKPGLMNARRKGLQTAQYDIVSFIDDDNWVETGWVQKVADVFAMNKKIGACGGRSEAVFEDHKPEWFDDYQSSFAVGVQAEQSGIIDDKKGFLWGAGLSFRKSLWHELENRGFKNLTVGREGKNISAGEDSELCYAIRLLGYHLYYNKDLGLKHFMPANRMNIKYLGKMFEGFGKAYARLNSYRVLLEKDRFKLHPWWYEWLASEKKIIKESFRSIFSSDKSIILQAKATKAYWKGYASQTWNDKSLLREHIASLKEIFPNK